MTERATFGGEVMSPPNGVFAWSAFSARLERTFITEALVEYLRRRRLREGR